MKESPLSVLFVDDEVRILKGIERHLRSANLEWRVEFESKPELASEKINSQCFDVIVSDMKMPVMDGAMLLRKAQQVCPRTVRVILSGHAEHDALVRAASVAHQYVAKPCDLDLLVARLSSIETSIKRLYEIGWQDQIPAITCFLSDVRALKRLKSVIKTATTREITELVAEDAGLSIKVLHLASSEFFGKQRRLLSLDDAVGAIPRNVIIQLVEEDILGVAASEQQQVLIDALSPKDLVKKISREGGKFDEDYLATLFVVLHHLLPELNYPIEAFSLLLDLWAIRGSLKEKCKHLTSFQPVILGLDSKPTDSRDERFSAFCRKIGEKS